MDPNNTNTPFYRELNDAALLQLAPTDVLQGSMPLLSGWIGQEASAQEHSFTELLRKLLTDATGEALPHRLELILDQYAPFEILHRQFGRFEKSFLREHLRHLIRDMLLALAIHKVIPYCQDPLLREAIIATLLHDIAYPIEHFKRNLTKYSEHLGENYLAGRFDLNVQLSDPGLLANVLSKIGEHPHLTNYYANVAFPALAEKSFFKTKHNFSGSVLYWSLFMEDLDPNAHESRFNRALNVTTAIALHDRGAMPWQPLDGLSTLMRLADELQEWERGGPIRMTTPRLLDRPGTGTIEIAYSIHEGVGPDPRRPDPHFSIPDKILGLWPLGQHMAKILLQIVFVNPTNALTKQSLIEKILDLRKEHALRLLQQIYFDRSGIVAGPLRSAKDTTSEQIEQLRKMLTREIRVDGKGVPGKDLQITLDIRGIHEGTPRVRVTQQAV